MFDSRRERILLAMVMLLLTALLIDSLVRAPLWQYVADARQRKARLQERIRDTKAMLDRKHVEGKTAFNVKWIRWDTAEDRTEFRKYLATAAGAYFEKSSDLQSAPVPGLEGFSRITHTLTIGGPLVALRRYLETLDLSDQELLRIRTLRLMPGSPETGDVKMMVTVSTIVRDVKDQQADDLEPREIPPRKGGPASRPPLAKLPNPFIPPAAGSATAVAVEDDFRLLAVTISGQGQAYVEFLQTGLKKWVKQGEKIGPVLLSEVRDGGIVLVDETERKVHLSVGRSSVDLHLNERVFLEGFDLIGIRQSAGMHVAVVRPHKGKRIYELRTEDKFGSHRVVKITAEGLTLRSDLTLDELTIAVGQRFAPEGKIVWPDAESTVK